MRFIQGISGPENNSYGELMDDEIGKQYSYLTILEDTGKKYHSTKIYKDDAFAERSSRSISTSSIQATSNLLASGDSEEEISWGRSSAG